MLRSYCLLLLLLLVGVWGCPPAMQPGDPNDSGDSSDQPDVVDNPDGTPAPPELFAAEQGAFVVEVTANRNAGVVGTNFQLQANAPGAGEGASFSWVVNAGEPFSTDAAPQIQFDNPGSFLVDATITDANGQSVTNGIVLTVFEPSSQDTGNATISPDTGRPGTIVQIAAPTLNDADVVVLVAVGNAAPFEPFRPTLGIANFTIPFDAADSLTEATEITIALQVDGQLRENFAFTLSPPATLPEAPGALFDNVLGSAPPLFEAADDALVSVLTDPQLALDAEREAVLRGWLAFASLRFAQVQEAIEPVLSQLSEEDRRLLDQVLIANGIDSEQLRDFTLTARKRQSNRNQNDDLIDALCTFHDIVDRLKAVLDAISVAAQLLNQYGLLTAGTPAGPPVAAAGEILSEISQALKITTILAELVPRVQDELQVTAIPPTLRGFDEKAVIRVKAQLTQTDLCALAGSATELVKFLSDQFVSQVVNQLLRRATSPAYARQLYLHTYRIGNTDPQAASEAAAALQKFLAAFVSNLVQSTVDIAALDALFQQILVPLCNVRESDLRAIQPEEMILTMTPSNGGRLLNLQDESIDFFCDIDNGSVRIEARRVCGVGSIGTDPRTLTGEVTITCGLEPCTEDASASIMVNVVRTNDTDIPSSCLFLQDTLRRTDATISVTNTHPTRTVKLAAVNYRVSDRKNEPRGVCEEETGEALIDCLQNAGGGCETALLGPSVGFSAFLLPGETSSAVPYICTQEFVFLPEDGDGTCGSALLETVDVHWIVQAVFCDNSENAKFFCDTVNPPMRQFGFPGNASQWRPTNREGCP